MADSGLRQFISYLLTLVRYDNGSASNAISAQISKTLPASLMKISTIITLILLPTMTLAQKDIVGKFVDKSYGTKYLDFRADFTFTFEIGIHLQHDIACGTYKRLNDTIYLAYKYNMTDTCCNVNQINVKAQTGGKYELLIEPETGWRPDTLFYNDNKLYEIKNNKLITKTAKF
ncbi:hypothetical protein ABIB40_003499 [Pedobacter sp. UYP30]|uniref:hypothetical protein n=1 Tax=Pedobacter sp. UYP30 TaxID=1756400 RepID=UPI003390A436